MQKYEQRKTLKKSKKIQVKSDNGYIIWYLYIWLWSLMIIIRHSWIILSINWREQRFKIIVADFFFQAEVFSAGKENSDPTFTGRNNANWRDSHLEIFNDNFTLFIGNMIDRFEIKFGSFFLFASVKTDQSKTYGFFRLKIWLDWKFALSRMYGTRCNSLSWFVSSIQADFRRSEGSYGVRSEQNWFFQLQMESERHERFWLAMCVILKIRFKHPKKSI